MQQQLSLPAEITIYTLGALRQEWLQWIANVPKSRRKSSGDNKPWLLDASKVDEVDASGVQLLLSLSHSLAAKQRTLRLVNASRPLANACHALGVAMLLEITDPAGACA